MDHRGDLYSVGVILYELLTGRLPFAGQSTMDVLLAHATEEPPRFARIGARPRRAAGHRGGRAELPGQRSQRPSPTRPRAGRTLRGRPAPQRVRGRVAHFAERRTAPVPDWAVASSRSHAVVGNRGDAAAPTTPPAATPPPSRHERSAGHCAISGSVDAGDHCDLQAAQASSTTSAAR